MSELRLKLEKVSFLKPVKNNLIFSNRLFYPFINFGAMSYLDELNEPQRKAVEHIDGPLMIIAGAGSGKTRVLTYRIAHLINNHVDAFNILSLTFTNKAAREMKERIASIIGDSEAKNLWMGTFHSVFAKILRIESEKIGYPSNFTIYDTQDSKNLLKTIIKEMKLDDKIYKPNLVLNRISSAKNNLINAAAYSQNTTIQSDDYQSAKPKISEIYKTYERRCFKAGAMDFDDLLFKTNLLLRDHPDVLFKYQEKFKYVMVDEFQDTNFSQYLILKQLAARFENICVVGDDAQSIYAFRGANIQNILNFKRDYPDTKVYKLEQNYRSSQNIVDAANSIIKHNKEQLDKKVWTSNEVGSKIEVSRALTDNEEGNKVASKIFELKNTNQKHNSDFAILYRTNAQSRAMEEALRKKGIEYKIYGGLSFYQRKEIKDLLSYFRLAINPIDEEALKRVINYPARGIGKTSLDKIILAANAADTSLWGIVSEIHQHNTGIAAGSANKINDFATMIKSFQVMLKTHNAYDIAEHIAKQSTILKDLYEDKTPEGVSRYENIQELLNGIKEFSDKGSDETPKLLPEFMEDIALMTDKDEETEEDLDKVSLMTVHASKGLEYPYVFIVGMEENLFPSQLSINDRADLEEERRLFYVALTRAEKQAFLSYATSRYKWGNLISCEPSRFIEEIDEKFLDIKDSSSVRPTKVSWDGANTNLRTPFKKPSTPMPGSKRLVKMSSTQKNSTTPSAAQQNITTGMQVEHDRFGSGTVENIEGNAPNQKATINFSGVGKKQLLLKFAKLTVLKSQA